MACSHLKAFDRPEDDDSSTDTTSVIPMPECNIRLLRLQNGNLTGTQLLRFVQSPHPILSALTLERVSGLQNSDLLAFLTVITSTITYLKIWDCAMDRLIDEEHALDVVMPSLSVITTLTVCGDQVSSLSIARKKPTPGCQSSILINNASSLICDGLPGALENGSWGSISITWLTALTEMEESLRQRAVDVARSRNIVLNCCLFGVGWVPPPSPFAVVFTS